MGTTTDFEFYIVILLNKSNLLFIFSAQYFILLSDLDVLTSFCFVILLYSDKLCKGFQCMQVIIGVVA